ncbi:hypothetical protein A3A60_01975 [Candidatus Curtissbacteria bacterium RIFCSPLOWO2_01_FULL_42_26]|uniref:Type II secretion system protein GspG C-terminal domain-containing protein n=1 Tax=Candidatus Curtissbacteria bacterium RIFCSPLOWO2_01_FULL_42_26 TaxID=1797729 RepID=A0A1F5I4F4_9BACT|nr:MAG: hypothetical protein A3A60_01975 [Candidatus Curtissbacteria bacterium RIFCSPLOWO2_01_FULL_42_26]
MLLALPKLASILYQVSCIKGLASKNTKYKILNTKYSKAKGFTLIELLVVIGILTVLLAIVLIAINPAKQFAQANNTQRRSDVNAILNAIHQYTADNKGNLPTGIDSTERTICLTGGTVTCPVNNIDLCADLVSKYLADLPRDPKDSVVDPATNGPCTTSPATDGYNTKYTAKSSATNNRVTVTATGESEGGTTPTISITR